jgi:hypothetical protein
VGPLCCRPSSELLFIATFNSRFQAKLCAASLPSLWVGFEKADFVEASRILILENSRFK